MRAAERKQAKLNGEQHYFTGKPCKHGHISKRVTANGACMECDRIKNHRRYEYYKEWVSNNKDKIKKIAANYQKNNKDKVNSRTAIRRGKRLKATPEWLNKTQKLQMEKTYSIAAFFTKESGEPYHVDHVVPLQGRNVCGLHVPWNLHVIKGSDNVRKGNKWK